MAGERAETITRRGLVSISQRDTRYVVMPVGAPIVAAVQAPEEQGSEERAVALAAIEGRPGYRVVKVEREWRVTPEEANDE